MVVHDLDAVSSVGLPDKTDPPLVVDADAVLAVAVGFQCLQLVARWDAQAAEFRGGMDLNPLAPRDALDVAEAGYLTAVKQGLGIGARERAESCAVVIRNKDSVKRNA